MQIRAVSDRNPDLFEITLKDLRREGNSQIEVGLSNVGFGISQVLPMIVQSLVSEYQIITIEQPEVHIHPRLQADLVDLFIESIEESRRNQFIIETHSEHLALRLQRRVREKKLSPDQISILYVSRGPNGSTVQPLRLDEEGDFIDDFPGGFFPERLRELR
jgi:predicted ATPase